MSKTKQLLEVVENLRILADSIQVLCDDGIYPTESTDKPDDSKTAEMPLEKVRGLLAKKSQEGKAAQVRELIQSFGVTKLSEVSSEHYDSLYQKAEVL